MWILEILTGDKTIYDILVFETISGVCIYCKEIWLKSLLSITFLGEQPQLRERAAAQLFAVVHFVIFEMRKCHKELNSPKTLSTGTVVVLLGLSGQQSEGFGNHTLIQSTLLSKVRPNSVRAN